AIFKSGAEPVTLAFSPDGKTLAAGGGFMDHPALGDHRRVGEIRIHDLTSGQLRKVLKEPNREFLSVAISPDGKLLATGSGTRDEEKSRPGLVRLWNAITGQLRVILKGHPGAVAGVAFSPDGKVLASYGPEGTIKRWDLASFRELSSTKIRTKR